jgi:hypothetical protein
MLEQRARLIKRLSVRIRFRLMVVATILLGSVQRRSGGDELEGTSPNDFRRRGLPTFVRASIRQSGCWITEFSASDCHGLSRGTGVTIQRGPGLNPTGPGSSRMSPVSRYMFSKCLFITASPEPTSIILGDWSAP